VTNRQHPQRRQRAGKLPIRQGEVVAAPGGDQDGVGRPEAGVGCRFDALAAESVQAELDIEAADRVPFETFRREYLSSRHLRLSGAVGSDAAAA